MTSPKDDRFSWIDEEDARADENQINGVTENPDAPRLVKQAKRAPKRTTRGIFVDDNVWGDFEKLVFDQKITKGKTKPELAEEALLYLISKYKKS